MPLDPWSYAEKTGKEHAHQAALFMWANMACRFGVEIANDVKSYTVAGYANEALHAIHSGEGYDPAVKQLKWLHAIHNQGFDAGVAGKIRGGHAKAEGVKAGVADMFLPVPMPKAIFDPPSYHGLYIELKVGKNKPDAKQLEFIEDMRAAGYRAEWVIGWEAARLLILDYLQLPS